MTARPAVTIDEVKTDIIYLALKLTIHCHDPKVFKRVQTYLVRQIQQAQQEEPA